MNLSTSHYKGALYAISSGLCYGFLGYFGVTLINSGLSISNMAFWRFFISAIMMVIILLLKTKVPNINLKAKFKILLYGMLFYSPSTVIYFIASRYLGTGLSMVIFFTYPALVMLFNVVYYKQKLSRLYYIAFSMLLIGMLCLVDAHEFAFDMLGIALAIISALSYACYMIASKKTIAEPYISTLMVCLGSMIPCLMISLLDSTFYVPTSLDIWFNIICISFICTAVPILLLLEALEYLSSEQASMLSVLEPVFVVIFGVILLGEHITMLQIFGTVTILTGALITLIPNKKS
jgi:drug/metabolite transporter (DMT)-like permease